MIRAGWVVQHRVIGLLLANDKPINIRVRLPAEETRISEVLVSKFPKIAPPIVEGTIFTNKTVPPPEKDGISADTVFLVITVSDLFPCDPALEQAYYIRDKKARTTVLELIMPKTEQILQHALLLSAAFSVRYKHFQLEAWGEIPWIPYEDGTYPMSWSVPVHVFKPEQFELDSLIESVKKGETIARAKPDIAKPIILASRWLIRARREDEHTPGKFLDMFRVLEVLTNLVQSTTDQVAKEKFQKLQTIATGDKEVLDFLLLLQSQYRAPLKKGFIELANNYSPDTKEADCITFAVLYKLRNDIAHGKRFDIPAKVGELDVFKSVEHLAHHYLSQVIDVEFQRSNSIFSHLRDPDVSTPANKQ